MRRRHLLFGITFGAAAVASVAGVRLLIALTVTPPEPAPWEGGIPVKIGAAPAIAPGTIVVLQGQAIGRVFGDRLIHLAKDVRLPDDSTFTLHLVGDATPVISVVPGHSSGQLRPWDTITVGTRD